MKLNLCHIFLILCSVVIGLLLILDHPVPKYLLPFMKNVYVNSFIFNNTLGISDDAYFYHRLISVINSFEKYKNYVTTRIAVNVFLSLIIPLQSDIVIISHRVGEMDIFVIESRHGRSDITVLYLHGGGFVSGGFKSHGGFVTLLAQKGFRVVFPEYRLSPEFTLDHLFSDVLSAYEWTVDVLGTHPEQLVVAGESAGGHLSLSLIQRLISDRKDYLNLGF